MFKKYLKKYLQTGRIKKIKLKIAVPVLFLKKKTGNSDYTLIIKR